MYSHIFAVCRAELSLITFSVTGVDQQSTKGRAGDGSEAEVVQSVVKRPLSSLLLQTHAICALRPAGAAKELPHGMQVAAMQLQKLKLLLHQPPLSGTSVTHNEDFLV